jgi:hypothetical protein
MIGTNCKQVCFWSFMSHPFLFSFIFCDWSLNNDITQKQLRAQRQPFSIGMNTNTLTLYPRLPSQGLVGAQGGLPQAGSRNSELQE